MRCGGGQRGLPGVKNQFTPDGPDGLDGGDGLKGIGSDGCRRVRRVRRGVCWFLMVSCDGDFWMRA